MLFQVCLCVCVSVYVCVCVCFSRSVMSNSLGPHGLQPDRLFCPWDSPGKNTGVGNHALLQGIFPTQGLNLGHLCCRQILYHLTQHRYIYLAFKCVVRLQEGRDHTLGVAVQVNFIESLSMGYYFASVCVCVCKISVI